MEFKTYDESRLDDHIELVNDVIKDWEWISWYPTKEQIKAVYSQEGFTPDTRHYLYDGDKLIAFLSSAVEEVDVEGVQHGSIHRPFVRKGYAHVEDKLLKKTLDELKARGVQIVRTNLKPGMGNLEEILMRWGFGERETMDYSVIFEVMDYVQTNFQKPNYLIDIDLNKDRELLIKAMCSDGKRTKEEMTKRIDNYLENDRIVAAAVAKENDEFLTYSLIFTGNKPERAFMLALPALKQLNEKHIKDIFTLLVNKAHKAGKVFLYHQIIDFDLVDLYNNLKLKFVPSYKYLLRFDQRETR